MDGDQRSGRSQSQASTTQQAERRRKRPRAIGLASFVGDKTKVLESVLDSLADGVIVANLEGEFLLFNEAAERIIGIGSRDVGPSRWSETYGCYLPDMVTPYPSAELPLARAVRGEAVTGVEIFLRNDRSPQGVWLSINGTPWRNESGSLCGGVVVFRDITSQKESSELVERLSSAVEQTADGVIITDRSGSIVYVNPAFEQITGYAREEALGQTPRLLKSGEHDQAFYEDLWVTISSGKVFRGTLVNCKKDGKHFYAEQSIAPIKDPTGRHTHYVSVFKDITERRRRQQLEVEMSLARVVQSKLYPESPPSLPGFDIAGAVSPAEALCGDYFDYFPMARGAQGIAIGDASGHGFGAALVMEETRAYLRSMAQSNSDVSEILSWVNGVLVSDLTQERFVTLLFVRLDVSKRSLVYASAGHVPGYILDGKGGIKTVLGATGVPLGLFGDRRCAASGEIVLDPGDIVILLTDGITESLEPQDSDLALERSLDFVRTHRHQSAAAIVKGLLAAVQDWTPAGPQVDDMTAIICKVDSAV